MTAGVEVRGTCTLAGTRSGPSCKAYRAGPHLLFLPHQAGTVGRAPFGTAQVYDRRSCPLFSARFCPRQQNVAVNQTKSPEHTQLQLMMSSSFSVFRVGIYFVMMCSFYKSAVDSLLQLSPQKYFSTLQPGKASLAYFCQADSPGTSIFLEELNEAVKPLQDCGISVAKVNCVKEETSRYCGKENDLMKAYLFRGNILIREFPTDTLFDVDAIIAHVLL